MISVADTGWFRGQSTHVQCFPVYKQFSLEYTRNDVCCILSSLFVVNVLKLKINNLFTYVYNLLNYLITPRWIVVDLHGSQSPSLMFGGRVMFSKAKI